MKHIKTRKKLENLGYTYQPLRANDIPCAHKEIQDFIIWAWLDKSKDIDISNLGHGTEVDVILDFYKSNPDKLIKSPMLKNFVYMRILFNQNTLACAQLDIYDMFNPQSIAEL